jgi:hypothetical protein
MALAAAAAIAGFVASPASAIPTDPNNNPCMNGTSVALTTSRSSVVWSQTVTLNWAITSPAGCPNSGFIRFMADATGVTSTYGEPSATSEQLTPPASGWYHLIVKSYVHV